MDAADEDRDRIAVDAFQRIAAEWQLTDLEAADLLGMDVEAWHMARQPGTEVTLSEDQLKRLSAVLGIRSVLHDVFSSPLSEVWITRGNAGEPYNGRRPIDVMIAGGFPAILAVRRHFEALGHGC